MEIKQIPLSLVYPSPMNPRKTFDEGELQELADNIERQGLLQPITVRPKTQDDGSVQYEIVCGERRYRATRLLFERWSDMDAVAPKGTTFNRFSEISAIVREMTDAEAFDAMITENLQRKDVDPIEEAYAFGQLIEHGSTAEDVALRFGKSVRFVIDRVKLNNLIPELMAEVKQDKMSISAAMIISKLDEDKQQQFYKTYSYSLSKTNAERFVSNLFMYLHSSPWWDKERDFEGDTCKCKCSECVNNTNNHGCLFWEMKSEGAGKCTNREKFAAKVQEYALHVVDKYADSLVKVGEPLVKGKIVVGIKKYNYETETDEKDSLRDKIIAKGYEVVNPQEYFESACKYGGEDKRADEFLAEGKVYQVLDLYGFSTILPEIVCYYPQKEDKLTNCNEAKLPLKVSNLIQEYKQAKDSHNGYYSSGANAIHHAAITATSLRDVEKKAICAIMLHNELGLKLRLGLKEMAKREEVMQVLNERIDEVFDLILRSWMCRQIHENNYPYVYDIESIIPQLGELLCKEEYDKACEDWQVKKNKKLKKLEKQIAALGYDVNGNPIAK